LGGGGSPPGPGSTSSVESGSRTDPEDTAP
jgi:hypothetical protein